jgi:sulfotransferase
MRKFFLMGGLPRSGSTLLANLIAQHPDVYCYGQDALPEFLNRTRAWWYNSPWHKQSPENAEVMLKSTLLHAAEGYYAHASEPVICMHSRGWPKNIEFAEWIFDTEVKLIVPHRNIADILASFEKLYRRNQHHQFPHENKHGDLMQTVEGRCRVWMDSKEVVGSAILRVRDAIDRGHMDKMLFVDYDELCNYPLASMARIWEFLGMEQHEHDFNNIEHVTTDGENDLVAHKIDNLHNPGVAISKPKSDAKDILGNKLYDTYNKKIM